MPPSRARGPEDQRLSDELARWLTGEGDKTIAGLIETFKEKSFAVLFAVLLGPAALPLPTGGVTHVLEAIAMLLALQLVAGRDEVWLPRRWRNLKLVGEKRERFLERLLRMIRWLERWSRPRGRFLFGHRVSTIVFGALVLGGSLAAFVAPRSPGSTRCRHWGWSCSLSVCWSRTSQSWGWDWWSVPPVSRSSSQLAAPRSG